MKLLFDTSVLIDHLRGDPRPQALLLKAVHDGDDLWSSVVVRTEILAGMRRGEEEETSVLLGLFRWQDVTLRIADEAGELARKYLKSHPGIDVADYLLAATARSLGAELRTQNVKHFPMFAKLKPAYA